MPEGAVSAAVAAQAQTALTTSGSHSPTGRASPGALSSPRETAVPGARHVLPVPEGRLHRRRLGPGGGLLRRRLLIRPDRQPGLRWLDRSCVPGMGSP